MEKFIHHERVPVEGGSEEDAYDVIEDEDGFNVVRDGHYMTPFDTLAEAVAVAYQLAEQEENHIKEQRRKANVSRTQFIDGSAKRYVRDLWEGDRVDLENDMYADADAWAAFNNGEDGDAVRSHLEFEFETVAWIERETEDCICVTFESGFSCRFPPDHLVDVDAEQ